MTKIDTALRERLLTLSTVTALIGGPSSPRVYTVILPQGFTLPAVLVRMIDDNEDMHMRGPVGMHRARVQVDSIAKTKSMADAIDSAVDGDGLGDGASGLKGFKGTIGSPPYLIHAIRPAGVRDDYNAEELREFRVMRDYFVEYVPV